ncbi:MAG: YggT family protein [Vulcanimicrobiaceae bacterium]
MSSLSCQLLTVLAQLLNLYLIAMAVYALVSWVPSLRGRWSDYLAAIIEPVLVPIRRIIPPMAGLDLAFLVLFLLIGYIARSIVPVSCYFAFH